MPAKAGTLYPKRHVWLTAYVPLLIWTFIVLGLGSGVGSMNETSRVIRPLLEFFFPSTSPEVLTVYHGYIRKLAHFVEYGFLAFLAVRAFAGWNRKYLLSILLVLAVAVIDETNQSFNSARTSSPWDVLLDLAGGSTMLTIYWMVSRRFRADR